MTYVVSYDLNRPGQQYTDLIAALRRDGGVPILLSQWLVQNSGNAAAVRDRYLPYLDRNDRMFVTTLGNWAYYNMMNQSDATPLLNG